MFRVFVGAIRLSIVQKEQSRPTSPTVNKVRNEVCCGRFWARANKVIKSSKSFPSPWVVQPGTHLQSFALGSFQELLVRSSLKVLVLMISSVKHQNFFMHHESNKII